MKLVWKNDNLQSVGPKRYRGRKVIVSGAAAMAVFALTIGVASAQRASPVGTWRVEDGSGNVRIARCGNALCGYADGGGEIFINMKREGSGWTGVIRDLRDNSRYDGTISVVDEGRLLVHGCVQGGGMCGDQTWTRAR
ncbi:MAG TPA: DUF2147 domain-containing protein [Beijerinckiaceae bacterium]|nr:DUF2147 domain-containing protein [Beijerinckiaceae bacterium]